MQRKPPRAEGLQLDWHLDPTILILVTATEAAYLLLVRRLHLVARGTRWPVPRTVAFSAGLLVVFVALTGPIDHYADLLLSVHMGQHMLLQLVAPPLLLLGTPMTLILRSNPPWPGRARMLRLLRTKPVLAVMHPATAYLAFVASLAVTHLTPLYGLALQNNAVHEAEHALFLTTGMLFWWQVVEGDPLPHRLSPPARLLYLFMAMPVMAFVGSAMAEASAPLYQHYAALPAPWGPQAVTDQHRAGTMMWEFGVFVIVPVMGAVLMRWLNREERDQTRYELATTTGSTHPVSDETRGG